MPKEINIVVDTKPFDDDTKVYQRKNFTFHPGLTSLVGCNGAGKSTLIMYLKEYARKNKVNYLDYNDRHSGGSTLMSKMGFFGDYQGLANMFCSSEGERIVQGLSPIFSQLKGFFKENKNKTALILLDAIDSGMSVDEIVEIRDIFLDVILPDAKTSYNCDCYAIIAANNYEWCNDSRITNLDVVTGKTLSITDYESFKNFILSSRKRKDKMRGVESN